MTAEAEVPRRPDAKAASPAPVPFETGLADLAELVARLESGSLGLSESIGAYEKGVAIVRSLHEQLAAVEERVRMLVRIDEQGRPVLEKADEGKASREKQERTAGRATRGKRLPGMDDAGEET